MSESKPKNEGKAEEERSPQKQPTDIVDSSINDTEKKNGKGEKPSTPKKKENDGADDKKESLGEKRPLGDDEKQASVPRKPVKRARTAYFIFTDDRRPEVQKQHPGEGVAVVAKALGQLWGSLTPELKQVYQEKAASERERVAKDLEAWKKANGGEEAWAKEVAKNQAKSFDSSVLAYPSARIRKICKLDPEVRGLSKEAVLLVTKVAELATVKLGLESVRVAQIQNRRKLLPEDVALVCRSREQFTFLKQDLSDLVRDQKEEKQESGKGGASKTSAAPTTSNPITSYFAPKKK